MNFAVEVVNFVEEVNFVVEEVNFVEEVNVVEENVEDAGSRFDVVDGVQPSLRVP